MNKKKILISSIIMIVVIALIGGTILFNKNKNKPIAGVGNVVKNNPTAVIPVSSTSVKLSCFDYIDKQLAVDGFTFLGGTKWGRGEKNLFIVDLAKQEFEMANPALLNVLPDNWYSTEYDRYVYLVYKHSEGQVILMDLVKIGATANESTYKVSAAEIAEPNNQYHEFPIWMNYYVSQFESHGCSISGLTEVKLGEYKTKMSKATDNDVVSVFDVKSTDGTISTFADVHTTGKVEDNPRYKEIQSMEDFIALKNASGFEAYYMINVINSSNSKVYDADATGLQASVIKEFTKDVVYTQTLSTEVANETKKRTLGVYFINIDNPNGNFKSLYTAGVKGRGFNFVGPEIGKNIKDFSIPYAGTVLGMEKASDTGYSYSAFNVSDISVALEVYITFIKELNPDVKFSSDFIHNFTRPFDINFKARFGLTKLFDAKYGGSLVDHSIKYIN